MSSILRGNAIEYVIDEFVAAGQESIVYRASVKSTQRCVALKFRYKEGLGKFRTKELPIYRQLDHLNIVKIFDYIEDIGGLRLEGEKDGVKFVIDNSKYFCIVEDFITGMPLENHKSSSLYNFCKQHSPKKEALYEEIISFQEDYIFKWIFEFCDIMSHMTKENRILHLDIKPENIMVTRTGSIVLIDMGLSGFMEDQSSIMDLKYDFDHIHTELKNVERRYITIENEKVLIYLYGTPGFAAPECYYKDGEGSDKDETLKNPFVSGRAANKDGLVDVRSDIFSFGCVLWDIIHLGGYGDAETNKDYATINKNETREGYFRRDLHHASPYYSQGLEDIIIKCTREEPHKRYQDYDELRRDAEKARRSLPKSEASTKKTKLLHRIGFAAIFITLAFFIIWQQGFNLGYEIALQDFRNAAYVYTEHTNPIAFRDLSLRLIEEAENIGQPVEPILIDILNTVASTGRITRTEFTEILLESLGDRDVNDEITILYINTAMKMPGGGNDPNTLANFIASRFRGADSVGYYIAYAIANRTGEDAIRAFYTLLEYQYMLEYRVSLNFLARQLLQVDRILNNPEYREQVEEIVRRTEAESE